MATCKVIATPGGGDLGAIEIAPHETPWTLARKLELNPFEYLQPVLWPGRPDKTIFMEWDQEIEPNQTIVFVGMPNQTRQTEQESPQWLTTPWSPR